MAVKPEFIDTVSYMWPRSGEDVTAGALETAAGVALVFGREGLARGWKRRRTGEVDDRDDDDCDEVPDDESGRGGRTEER